jgi:hypothetical protein
MRYYLSGYGIAFAAVSSVSVYFVFTSDFQSAAVAAGLATLTGIVALGIFFNDAIHGK